MDPWMPNIGPSDSQRKLKYKGSGEGKEEEDENVDSAWIKYLKTVFDDTGYYLALPLHRRTSGMV
jgi:hypothetical protein